jgi:ribonuclease P protein component
MFFRPNRLGESRLGITTPTRLGKAVRRNRIRRRLREVFRLNYAALPKGLDIVLNPRPPVAAIPYEALEREMLKLFSQASPGPAREEPRERSGPRRSS